MDVDATMTAREIREAISDAAYEWNPQETFLPISRDPSVQEKLNRLES